MTADMQELPPTVEELTAEIGRLRQQLAAAERKVQAGETRYSLILNSAVDYAIIALDLDGAVTEWNEGAHKILGWTEAEMLGRPAAVFFTEEDRRTGIPQKEMVAALEDGHGSDERWHVRKDGSRFFASGEMMPLKNEAGVVQGLIKVLRDRTEQRRADEKRSADAEFLRSVLASSGDCIKVLDLDGRLHFMSEGGMRVMEVSDFNAIRGCPWPDFWSDAGHERARAALDAARRGETGRFQGFADTMAGHSRWWDVQVTPILGANGRPERILSVSRDLTAAKLAEQAMQRSEQRYRTLYNAIDMGFCIIEVQCDETSRPVSYRFLEVNDAFRRHTGLDDMTGRWLRNWAPEHEQYWFDRYAEFARGGQAVRFEYTAPGLGGRDYEAYAYRIGSPDEHQVAILFSDISARKRDGTRRAALFELGDRLAEQDETAGLTDVACSVLGQTLGVQLVGYGLVDPEAETITVERDWTTCGARSLAGTLRFRDFGSYIDDLRRGETVVVTDARTDPRTRAFAAELEARTARAFVNTPVFEGGRFVALQYVSTGTARDWSEDELLLIQEVAARTRAATARQQAESDLRASEAYWRSLFEQLNEGFMVVEVVRDAAGAARTWRFAEINDAWERISGLSQAAARGRNVDDVIPGIEQEWLDIYIRVAETGEPAASRMSLKVLGQVYDVRASRVGPDRVGVLFQEISAQQSDEIRRAALLELNDRLHDLDDPAEMSLAAAEIMGRTLGVDRAGYGTMGADGTMLTVERDWTAPGFASSAGHHRMSDYGAYSGDLYRGEAVVIADTHLDPRTAGAGAIAQTACMIRALVNLPLIEGGRLVALLFVNDHDPRAWTAGEIDFIRNVAEHTRAAIERRRAERELSDLAASLEQQVQLRTRELDRAWRLSQELLVVALPDGTMTAVNPIWTQLLGWDSRELIGSNLVAYTHPDDLEATLTAFSGMLGAPLVNSHDYRLRHKDGSYRWFGWTGAFEDGKIYASGRDLMVERQQAEALRQSQKMEAVGQLTGGVAHDFNNLLTIIRSSVDFLRRPGLPDDRRQRYIEAVSDTVDRAAKLTSQLLAFARQQALKPEVFDAGAKLRGVGEMLDTVTGSRVVVAIEVPGHPCLVRADVSQFETALINMAVNARDAMSGQGRLTLGLHASVPLPRIRGHAGSGGRFIAVFVTDTGSGIPADQLTRIFEPFFTTKEVGRGTGLGLSQVFGFAKQSGGDVDVQSVVGEGSTFTLYLPQEQAAPMPGGALADPETGPGGAGQCILIVEDNVEVGQFCTQILSDLGYRTTLANNAEEALAILGVTGDGFDAVFSDVVMPGMGGVALAEALRQRLPGLPVVLTSGYSHVLASDAEHGFELLHKPYSAEQVGRVLQRIIAKSEAARASGQAR